MKIVTAFDYLKNERKLTDETVRKFHLAWCDSTGEIYIDADFIGTLPNMPVTMRNSAVFPIMDLYGNCIAVSCRPLLFKPNSPKYINSVYEKSEHLYGLSVVYKELLKEQKVYIVEGNLDVLQTYQAGIHNVVGLLGSAFSFTQLCLLSRFVKTICIVPDGDKAGAGIVERLKKAMAQKFYDADVKFTYKQLPQGLDPDNYLKKYTKQDFLNLPESELSL